MCWVGVAIDGDVHQNYLRKVAYDHPKQNLRIVAGTTSDPMIHSIKSHVQPHQHLTTRDVSQQCLSNFGPTEWTTCRREILVHLDMDMRLSKISKTTKSSFESCTKQTKSNHVLQKQSASPQTSLYPGGVARSSLHRHGAEAGILPNSLSKENRNESSSSSVSSEAAGHDVDEIIRTPKCSSSARAIVCHIV